jgi:hypothetical protein
MPNNMILLETIALTQSAASVTFDNLPTSGYTDLKVVVSARSSVTSGSNTWEDIGISFNGGAVNNSVTSRVVFGYSSTVGSATNANWAAGFAAAPSATASTFSNTELYIPNYRSNVAKSYSGDTSSETNAASGINGMVAGLWNPGTQAAITSIGFSVTTGTSPLFVAGSTFSLYGIAAFGTTPVLAPKATGGNRVENDGTYWIHTFLTSGNFVPQVGLTCDYLVVAGGGGSGAAGGGGGAGGYRTSIGGSALSVTTQTYPVTVGAGGPGAFENVGTNGSDSIFSTITSTGGGGGASDYVTGSNGKNGGSGGGAQMNPAGGETAGTGNTPSTSPSQGNNGGAGSTVGTGFGGGGGGGSSAVGAAGAVTGGGAGGAGTSNSISGASVSYAGGGGGGCFTGTAGAGGAGGGGAGTAGAPTSGNVGTVNTGGGAGGSGGGAAGSSGAAGGSGIVIIRYPIA